MKNGLFEASDFGHDYDCNERHCHPRCLAMEHTDTANTLLAERDQVRDAVLRTEWLGKLRTSEIIAIAKRELIKDAPVVYGHAKFQMAAWSPEPDGLTHTARLVQIEPIRCKHDMHGQDCFECYPTEQNKDE